MGKIIISENVSLDGVVQDPTGEEGFRLGGWFGHVGDRDLPHLHARPRRLAAPEGASIPEGPDGLRVRPSPAPDDVWGGARAQLARGGKAHGNDLAAVQADRLAAHRRRIHLRALAARGWRKTPSEAARAASSAVLAAVRRGGRPGGHRNRRADGSCPLSPTLAGQPR